MKTKTSILWRICIHCNSYAYKYFIWFFKICSSYRLVLICFIMFLLRRIYCIRLMKPYKMSDLNIQIEHDIIIIIVEQVMVVHTVCFIFHLLIQRFVFIIIVVVLCFGFTGFSLKVVCNPFA